MGYSRVVSLDFWRTGSGVYFPDLYFRVPILTFIHFLVLTGPPDSETDVVGCLWRYATDTWFRPHTSRRKGHFGRSISEAVADTSPDFLVCNQKLVIGLRS